MSVTSYKTNEGKTFWKIYINIRSKNDPKIRVQKTEQGIDSKGKAERREKELIESCYREIIKIEGSDPTLKEICLKWEKHLQAIGELSETTIEDYVSAIRIWCESILEKCASEINKADVRYIMSNLSEAGKSTSYQSKILNALKRLYIWGKEEGLIKGGLDNITAGIKVKKVIQKAPEILTAEEIRKLLSEAKFRNNPWYPIWASAVFTGMRNGELYALTWDDIDFSNDLIAVTKSFNKRTNSIGPTKGGYYRMVPINDSVRELLLELKNGSNGPEVFPKMRKWQMGLQAQDLRFFCEEIGISSIKFHSLRACFATHMLSRGASTPSVMKVGGWAGIKTMDIYVRRAGVCEKGVTDCLDPLSPIASDKNVVAFRA